MISAYNAGDQIGQKERQVFCSRKSAVRSEYYAAYAVGLKPRAVLEIDPMDWWEIAEEGHAPNKVRYRGEELVIYREYQVNESSMELTVG